MTELETPGSGAKAAQSRKRSRRWPALIGGLVLAALKSDAIFKLIAHRGSLIGVVAFTLAVSVFHTSPQGIAVALPLLLALALGAHSLGLGLALGFGGVALLTALFFAISTVLHARQDRASTRS